MQIQYRASLGFALALCGAISANAATWDTSANIRERYQSFDNFNFNSAVNKNSWEFDSRLYIKTKGDLGHGLTMLLQPQAILIKNHTQANGNQNFSQADLIQAYLQYNLGDIGLRIGRQQLVYGDQRLLGHLGWKDVARTFDGIKGMYKSGPISLDLFAVHPADIVAMTPSTASPQGQSLVTWEDRRLIGAYGTYTVAPKSGIDAYIINWQHNQHASIGKGRNINTFGTRLFGKLNGFDGTAETVFQRGTWATGTSQQASAYAAKVGYTLGLWKTRFGVEYDFSPGDANPKTGPHKDFVFPFHTNHMHYGEMDRFSWANMKDLRLSLKTSPAKGLALIGNVHFLSLDKAQGDWLNVVGAGKLYAGKSTYTKTKAGTEIDLKVVYKLAAINGLKLVGLYGVFNPGAAVSERNAGKADSAKFGYLIAQYQF
ncbi:MAG: alginate export family protein [Mariprofundales bacterium]|nr:alginate export family protein [Mariprofundales bacterium]